MKADKSLQKFTDYESKKEYLDGLEVVKSDDLSIFNEDEKETFFQYVLEKVNALEGMEKHIFALRYQAFFSDSERNALWENNHSYILTEIINFTKEYGIMPSKSKIAERTGLSRTTVHKHMEELASIDLYSGYMDQFKMLVPSVLSVLYKLSCYGDVSAAKLFLNTVGATEVQKPQKINASYGTQQNFIQINNTTISQEQISSLNSDQIKQLENILNNV